ncbi:AMP-binding protein [Kribbella sp. NBC_01245]|uniref:AMP-binding protein n=1 Tax=Kribbella sp. NBC_01245 TaxID=2903578 RepID=UPI002E29B291|nr:AMP-binding protein [Kribbella sp. NBC_01245]
MKLTNRLRTAAEACAIPASLLRSGVWRAAGPGQLMPIGRTLHQFGQSVATLGAVAAIRFPDRPAVIDDLGTITYRQLDRRCAAQAAGLAASFGIGAGSKVAVLCRNHKGFLEATLAAGRLGADVYFLNTGLAAPQLDELLKRNDPDLLILDQEFVPLVEESGRGVRRLLAWHDDDTGAASLDRLAAGNWPEPAAPDHPGRIVILTSGTTGTPKAAPRVPTAASLSGLTGTVLRRVGLRAGEPALICPPLFHGLGLLTAMLALFLGSPLVLMRRFDPAVALAAVERHRAGSIVAVPVMLQRMLELPADEVAKYDLTSLRAVVSGASALSPALAERFMARYGAILCDAYGSSEIGIATLAGPADLKAAPGTVGRPCLGSSVVILDQYDRPLPAGETGRIFAGGGLVFGGYLGGGSKTVVDGRMSTGDLGHLDVEGRLFVDGREDDMIVSGGENVYPVEVENCLAAHPAVADVAVVGVDDEEFGQRLIAYVVPTPGRPADPDALREYVRTNLARFKTPRQVVLVDELPRNATGKVLRNKLPT